LSTAELTVPRIASPAPWTAANAPLMPEAASRPAELPVAGPVVVEPVPVVPVEVVFGPAVLAMVVFAGFGFVDVKAVFRLVVV